MNEKWITLIEKRRTSRRNSTLTTFKGLWRAAAGPKRPSLYKIYLAKHKKTSRRTMILTYCDINLRCSKQPKFCVVCMCLQIMYHSIPCSTINVSSKVWIKCLSSYHRQLQSPWQELIEIFNSCWCHWIRRISFWNYPWPYPISWRTQTYFRQH